MSRKGSVSLTEVMDAHEREVLAVERMRVRVKRSAWRRHAIFTVLAVVFIACVAALFLGFAWWLK